MSESIDPNTIFEATQHGIADNYWGQDMWGTDMWEYKFTGQELNKANDLLQTFDMAAADIIAVARNDEPSSMTRNGLFIPGRDCISFQLTSGNIITLISFSKYKSINESAETTSDIVIVEKDIQVDKDYSDITNLLTAIIEGKDLYKGVEGYDTQLKEVTIPEMLAVSALMKMLKHVTLSTDLLQIL